MSIKGKQITEEINKGHMDRVRMLETLREYGGQCTDKNDCNMYNLYINDKDEDDKDKDKKLEEKLDLQTLFESYETKPSSELRKYPYILKYRLKSSEEKKKWRNFYVLNLSSSKGGKQTKNKYIMMAHIMRGAMNPDGYISQVDLEKYCDATKATLEFAQSIKSDVGICSQINSSRWTDKPVSSENCDRVYDISDLKTFTEYFSSKSMAGGGKPFVELLPSNCNYQIIKFKPYEMNKKTGSILGLVNSNNFSNRLSKMLRTLNRGQIKTRRRGYANPRSYRKRFNSKMKRCRK